MKSKIKTRCYICQKCNKTVYFQSNMEYETRCKTCKSEMQLMWEDDYKPNNGLNAIKSSNATKRNNTESSQKEKPIIYCPYCNSSNTSKISTTRKVINTALFGIFGTKRQKQCHSNQCNSDF